MIRRRPLAVDLATAAILRHLSSVMYKPRTVGQPAELLPYLFASWPSAKRKQVRTWLKYQSVLVNGRVITQFNHPLKPGDVVAIRSGHYAAPDTVIAAGIKVHFED